ncbi:MAG: hypothetical protein HDR71_16975 [Lachnospiraceae bacterium]|nr:hypothetical protein [Lachnospiraceae bacterium]
MQDIKKLEDVLNKNDIVRAFCNKCNANTLFRILAIDENVTGICSKCRGFKTLKRNENYVPKTPIKNIPKCPTCQSINITKIGTGERVASVAMLGIFSKKINKSFKCKNCGYTW